MILLHLWSLLWPRHFWLLKNNLVFRLENAQSWWPRHSEKINNVKTTHSSYRSAGKALNVFSALKCIFINLQPTCTPSLVLSISRYWKTRKIISSTWSRPSSVRSMLRRKNPNPFEPCLWPPTNELAHRRFLSSDRRLPLPSWPIRWPRYSPGLLL